MACTSGAVSKMKRVGFLLKVKHDRLEEYRRHHEAVWPEMLQALRESGWYNYSLFVREDGLLFGYFETPASLQAAQAQMAVREINTRWQEFMAPYFESPNNSRPDEMFEELTEIFHLD
jgi:L-rhamnose mutarotase